MYAGAVRRWSHRVRALVAALTLLAPWAQTALAAAHELAGHDHPQAARMAALEVLVHGHSHAEGTPSHSHAFVAPEPPSRPAQRPAMTPLASQGLTAAAARVELRGPGARGIDGRFGTGPPLSSLLSPVLRV